MTQKLMYDCTCFTLVKVISYYSASSCPRFTFKKIEIENKQSSKKLFKKIKQKQIDEPPRNNVVWNFESQKM